MTERFEISRRKALAGLGTIGVASVGAGLGTSALFSDEESFEGNTITAGTFDMSVTATVVAASEDWTNATEVSAIADGEAVTGVSLADVKPGDWAIVCFDVSIGDNPGYVRVSTDGFESRENGYAEPEPEDDNGEGELEEHIVAEVYSGFDESADSDPPRSHLSGQHPATPDGTTLSEAVETYGSGVTLGGSGGPMKVGSGEDSATFYLLLEVADAVGNEIQGDSLSFDLVFEAEQARNNDDPFNSTA